MKNKILKEALNLVSCISFGLAIGMFYAIWIMKWEERWWGSMLQKSTLKMVQGYFAIQDANKELLFNATNEEQYESAKRLERHLDDIIKNLYVPMLPTINT